MKAKLEKTFICLMMEKGDPSSDPHLLLLLNNERNRKFLCLCEGLLDKVLFFSDQVWTEEDLGVKEGGKYKLESIMPNCVVWDKTVTESIVSRLTHVLESKRRGEDTGKFEQALLIDLQSNN